MTTQNPTDMILVWSKAYQIISVYLKLVYISSSRRVINVMAKVIGMIVVLLASFGLNIPLGIWRAGVKKFSLSWFISIHLAVPLIYFLRVSEGLPYWTIPIFITAALLGQFSGSSCGSCLCEKFKNILRFSG